jgi:glucose/arabinose dehydrogenase
MRINMVTGLHGMQEIVFNPYSKPGAEDYGLLYIGIGDGGAVENGFQFLVRNRSRVWGTILRIDPAGKNSTNGKYGIPVGNPFAKSANKKELKEIYAYGFRNPHRITWLAGGQMLASNIGHANIESINIVQKGADYGWPIREGRFLLNPLGDLNKVFALPANDKTFHITYPAAEYDHDEGKAISGGFEYTGKAVPRLRGKFLFGDIQTGRLFYIDLKDLKQRKPAVIKEWRISINDELTSLKQLCGSSRVDLHFGKDSDGELYILTKADGKVYRLVNTN